MKYARTILAGEFGRITHVLRPARLHRDATIVRQPTISLLPIREILAGKQVVGILRRLRRYIDDRERHDESVRWNFLDRGTGFRKMDRRIQMRAGMFDEPPPIKIEAIFRKIEFLLHLDSRHAEKGRKISGHGMGEIDGRGEAARG